MAGCWLGRNSGIRIKPVSGRLTAPLHQSPLVRPSGAFSHTVKQETNNGKLMLTLMRALFAMSVNGVAVAADAAKMDAKSMQAQAEGDYKAARPDKGVIPKLPKRNARN